MTAQTKSRFALLVNAAPHGTRESRAELDVALAALSLDFAVDVYFNGAAVLQLARSMEAAEVLLPPGYRGWAALGDLGEARLFAETEWVHRCREQGIELIGPPRGLTVGEMACHWRACDTVWSL